MRQNGVLPGSLLEVDNFEVLPIPEKVFNNQSSMAALGCALAKEKHRRQVKSFPWQQGFSMPLFKEAQE